jgi:thiamine-phosphate diphosphorylase
LPAQATRLLRVGRSSHDEEQAQAAIAAHPPLAYLAFGPLFGTTSKPSPYEARGLLALREIADLAAPLPVVAIGGITIDNVADVARAGASGVAVISAVAAADDPAQAVRDLAKAFADAREARG